MRVESKLEDILVDESEHVKSDAESLVKSEF